MSLKLFEKKKQPCFIIDKAMMATKANAPVAGQVPVAGQSSLF